MAAGRYDIVVEQGSNFRKVLDVNFTSGALVDLTGYTFLCAVKQNSSDVDPILSFTVTQDGVLTNRLAITATASQTAAILDTVSTVCFWDLQIIAPDTTNTRLLEGIARIDFRIAP